MRHIFISLCGKSPAVITESLYQLHYDNSHETPDEIVVITTTAGAECIKNEFFDGGIWESFKSDLNITDGKMKFGNSAQHIRLLPDEDGMNNATDLNGTNGSRQAADYILNVLRQFTENPDTQITFSIAGGRKTMTALGALAMSLLGQRQDILCHVLVNPPFDRADLSPKFYYPNKKSYQLPDGTIVTGTEAVISLSEIPFMRCRYLFNDRLNQLPGNFLDSVDRVNGKIAENLDTPELILKPETTQCFIGELELKFNATEFVLYWLLATRCKNSCPPLHGQDSLLDEFKAFATNINSTVMPEIIHYEHCKGKTIDDMRRLISVIASKIKKVVAIDLGRNFCLPSRDRGVYGLLLPPDNIVSPRNY
jgi:CRISPR-associated protein (TIGR02584 family)